MVQGDRLLVRKFSQFLPTLLLMKGWEHSWLGLLLFPEDQDGSHDEIANELIAGVDAEELHALLSEQGSRELHRGDEAEPDMETGHQAKVQGFRAHSVQNQRQSESAEKAGGKGASVGWSGTFAHFVHFCLVIGVVAHFAGPGFGEEQRRIPEEAKNHGGNSRHQDGKPIQAMHVHL